MYRIDLVRLARADVNPTRAIKEMSQQGSYPTITNRGLHHEI